MGIIEWLNTNSGVIIAIAAIVLVGVISYYAYLTWRFLKANNTPEIAISLRPHEAYIHCVMLCIENIGRGAEFDQCPIGNVLAAVCAVFVVDIEREALRAFKMPNLHLESYLL